MQRILRSGGAVKVAFLTSGDGFPAGVALARHTLSPTAQDYRQYGMLRQEEAKQALRTLGIPAKNTIFLGFPDGGLCPLHEKYWPDTGPDYTSPFTLEDRPSPTHARLPNTEYNGEDLQRELAWVLRNFRPTLIATTHPRDRHPDHCATYLFVKTAVQDLQRQDPTFRPSVLTFLIHYGSGWPTFQEVGTGTALRLPRGFPEPESAWMAFPLSSAEVQAKRQALLAYHSQMLAMGWYLLSFVRTNELFSLDHPRTPDELGQLPCSSR
jgi:LmbE family N-acetylglucosaminyl deacetylase